MRNEDLELKKQFVFSKDFIKLFAKENEIRHFLNPGQGIIIQADKSSYKFKEDKYKTTKIIDWFIFFRVDKRQYNLTTVTSFGEKETTKSIHPFGRKDYICLEDGICQYYESSKEELDIMVIQMGERVADNFEDWIKNLAKEEVNLVNINQYDECLKNYEKKIKLIRNEEEENKNKRVRLTESFKQTISKSPQSLFNLITFSFLKSKQCPQIINKEIQEKINNLQIKSELAKKFNEFKPIHKNERQLLEGILISGIQKGEYKIPILVCEELKRTENLNSRYFGCYWVTAIRPFESIPDDNELIHEVLGVLKIDQDETCEFYKNADKKIVDENTELYLENKAMQFLKNSLSQDNFVAALFNPNDRPLKNTYGLTKQDLTTPTCGL